MGTTTSSRRSRFLLVGVATGVLAMLGSLLTSSPTAASNGTGNYANWSMSGTSGTLPAVTEGFLGAAITSHANVNITGGATTWLPAWTPFGREYGSSQNKKYLAITVPTNGNSVTLNFSTPTPMREWGFALGDVDAERVRIRATGVNGKQVKVNSWYKDSFNFCSQTPRPNACSGTQNDVPTWNGRTLSGNGSDTTGATGWFQPDVQLTSLTFEATRIIGFPVYTVWLAADKQFSPKAFPPVTVAAQVPVVVTPPSPTPGPPAKPKRVLKPVTTCTSKTKRVTLTGTTRRKSEVVTLYRSTRVGKPAKAIKRVKSKNRKFRVNRVSTRNCTQPVFCARTARSISAPVRLRVKSTKRIAPRGEAKRKKVVCRARGSR